VVCQGSVWDTEVAERGVRKMLCLHLSRWTIIVQLDLLLRQSLNAQGQVPSTCCGAFMTGC
jgi:hypothetical protein